MGSYVSGTGENRTGKYPQKWDIETERKSCNAGYLFLLIWIKPLDIVLRDEALWELLVAGGWLDWVML